MLAKQCLLFFITCCMQGVLLAQIPGYKPFVIDEDDAGIRMYSIYKNQKGYIYAGTSKGLYRFDGKAFWRIHNATGASEDTITAIFEDRAHRLWTGSLDGRIATGQGTALQYINPEEGLPKKRITAFLQDQQQQLWFATNGEGIYYFKNQRLYLVNEANGLTDLHVHALALAGNGDILAATDQGLNICRWDGQRYKASVLDPRHGLPDYIVTSIVSVGNNECWIGFQDKGFCHYNHNTGKIAVPAAAVNWNKGQVNALLEDGNTLWIATQDSGLLRYDPGTQSISNAAPEQKNVLGLARDLQGNVWLATDHQLVRTAGKRLQLLPLYNEAFAATVHTVMVDHNNHYWVGTDMAVVEYSEGKSKRYPIPGLDSKTDITSLYEDAYHHIWIGTMGRGVIVLDPATGNSRQLTEALNDGSNSILSITGRHPYVCTAGLEGAMVFQLDSSNQNITQQYHYTPYNNIETVGSTYIYNVFVDSRARTWFATDGKGLTMLDGKGFTNFNQRDGIQDNHIYAVTEDAAGTIWFSTSKAGVYAYDGKRFKNYGTAEGLSALSISSLLTDAAGNVVVLHKAGIDVLNPATGRFSYINSAQQIPTLTDDLGAMCKDKQGNLYVATNKGLLQYSADQSIQDYPITYIEAVQLFLNTIDTAVHTFRYDENNFTFRFSGLYYNNPAGVYYRYKLEGFDSTWQLTSDNNKIFPRLAPGKYLFRIQSSLNDNFNHATEAAYAFEIEKPYWKKWWFMLSYCLLGAGVFYLYIHLRERNLKRVAALQEEKIKFQFDVLRNQVNPHFLFNSFNTLISTIEEDPKTAVEYVEHLSDFFRNVVTYRDKDLIPLREEKQLLASYLYMQQKRYGSHLALDTQLADTERDSFLIPPLTLQLLVENAIKHNVVSKEAKLLIRIYSRDGFIVVENNINQKLHAEKGTGMGLQNIINRYALLVATPVLVNHTAAFFSVSLPIIKR